MGKMKEYLMDLSDEVYFCLKDNYADISIWEFADYGLIDEKFLKHSVIKRLSKSDKDYIIRQCVDEIVFFEQDLGNLLISLVEDVDIKLCCKMQYWYHDYGLQY